MCVSVFVCVFISARRVSIRDNRVCLCNLAHTSAHGAARLFNRQARPAVGFFFIFYFTVASLGAAARGCGCCACDYFDLRVFADVTG